MIDDTISHVDDHIQAARKQHDLGACACEGGAIVYRDHMCALANEVERLRASYGWLDERFPVIKAENEVLREAVRYALAESSVSRGGVGHIWSEARQKLVDAYGSDPRNP